MYYVASITSHPDGKGKCDDEARWWPDWHKYSMDNHDTVIFRYRLLLYPRLIPDKTHNDDNL